MTWRDVVLVVGGLVAGLFSGTIGIGGGLLFVPTMTVALRIPQAVAQGTSLAAIVPTAVVGAFTHFRQGNVQVAPALWMGGGGVVGAILGSIIAVEVPQQLLARLFGLFLIFSAYRLGSQALRRTQKTP